jgi:hypothetical protein
VSSQLLALGRNMYTKGLDQQDEFDADRSGVALAARRLRSLRPGAVLQQLRTAGPDDALFALSLSTHPPAQTRLNQLEQAMGTRLDAYAGQPAVTVAQRVSASNRRPTAGARHVPAKKTAEKIREPALSEGCRGLQAPAGQAAGTGFASRSAGAAAPSGGSDYPHAVGQARGLSGLG